MAITRAFKFNGNFNAIWLGYLIRYYLHHDHVKVVTMLGKETLPIVYTENGILYISTISKGLDKTMSRLLESRVEKGEEFYLIPDKIALDMLWFRRKEGWVPRSADSYKVLPEEAISDWEPIFSDDRPIFVESVTEPSKAPPADYVPRTVQKYLEYYGNEAALSCCPSCMGKGRVELFTSVEDPCRECEGSGHVGTPSERKRSKLVTVRPLPEQYTRQQCTVIATSEDGGSNT